MELEYAYLFTSCAFVVKPLHESPRHLSQNLSPGFLRLAGGGGKRALLSLTAVRKDSKRLALLASLSYNSYQCLPRRRHFGIRCIRFMNLFKP